MTKVKNVIFSAASVSMVAACSSSWNIEAVKNMNGKGGAFDNALKNEYSNIATEERSEGDWDAVRYFVRKARTAANGQAPEIESLTRRELPENQIEKVALARKRLAKAFEKGAKINHPEQAAKAQASYEEWTQELEENRQSEDIARAKAKFEKAMNAIENKPLDKKEEKAPKSLVKKVKDVVIQNKSKKTKAKSKVSKITKTEKTPAPMAGDNKYVVYFSFAQSNLKDDAKKMVLQAAKAFRERKIKKVIVGGHTDRVGTEKVNLYVSRLRARAVSIALNKAGIPAENIRLQAFGEYKNAIKTNDEIRSAKNRRVEISFQ